jgi:acylphosphatase
MLKTIHFTVRGRVQGVGFRYSTLDKATGLGLTGWVRNMANGNVEGVAQGREQSLEIFRKWLKQGPSCARVSRVETELIEREAIPNFQITR